jgi:diguanylate cyclase
MNLETESKTTAPDINAGDMGYNVVKFLLDHGLSTDPLHYEVAYAFLNASHAKLTAAMQAKLQKNKSLDTHFMLQLHDQYMTAEAMSNFDKIGRDMRELLGELINEVKEAGLSTTGFSDALQENLSRLDEVTNSDGIKRVAMNLAEAVVKASTSNAGLMANLEATEQEAKLLREKLEQHRLESVIDPLTGLYNRRGLIAEIDKIFSPDTAADHSMLVIDIDHFKKINDSYGHSVGDAVLRKLAETLRTLLPKDAVSARYGGEEFVVLLFNTPLVQAKRIAEEIRLNIERLRIVRRRDNFTIEAFTVSVGVADKIKDDTAESLFERADFAMYKAKNAGRNRVETAS